MFKNWPLIKTSRKPRFSNITARNNFVVVYHLRFDQEKIVAKFNLKQALNKVWSNEYDIQNKNCAKSEKIFGTKFVPKV